MRLGQYAGLTAHRQAFPRKSLLSPWAATLQGFFLWALGNLAKKEGPENAKKGRGVSIGFSLQAAQKSMPGAELSAHAPALPQAPAP